VTLGVLALAFALGCAPNRGATYTRALAAGVRAESAGRFEEAAARFEEAGSAAKVARDGAHARYLGALMRLRSGDVTGARARLDAIAAEPAHPDAVDAAYRAAEVRVAAGDDEGWRRFEALVRTFPSNGLARPALYRVLRHKDDTLGKAQTIAFLRDEEKALGEHDIAEDLAYQIALRLADLGQPREARDAFVAVATRWPYPQGALFDDALYRASELDEALGEFQRAVDDLNRMLVERESAYFNGSYQRPRYTPALWRIATLYRDRLHDNERARSAFHRLYADFTTSTRRDDALWEEAALWRVDGDTGAACSHLSTLVTDFADSRYVPCATRLCPRVKRPSASHAPTECHPYIERRSPPIPNP
jgi:tetratricopeptide (TPR) repeat protein